MEIKHHKALPVTEKSQAAEARRYAVRLAGEIGLPRTDTSNVAIIVTELAMNLVKHASQGELLLHKLGSERSVGVEVLALDKGPGMANVGRCLEDGYSSTGSPGTGLGAVRRLSTSFDVYSVPQMGTAMLARCWSSPGPEPLASGAMDVGVVCIPKPGQSVCGDAWAMSSYGSRSVILMVDGIGHGLYAAEAAQTSTRVFLRNSSLSPTEILRVLDDALIGSRGAAAAVAEVDPAGRVIKFAGVGNISACVVSRNGNKNMVSHNGTVGGEIRKLQEFIYPWDDQAILLMHSDGLASRWNLERYPGILHKPPSLIAGVLYRDNSRGTDDVTVLVARTKA